MTKERLLTVGWSNMLALGVGLPALVYIVAAYSTSAWTSRTALIGLAVIGVLY